LVGFCLANRLSHHIDLTDAERAALNGLEADQVHVRRGTSLIAEGERSTGPYIVHEGWLRSSVLLGNGGRQIVRISLPGELIGLSALAYPDAAETICALTDAVVCPIDRRQFGALFDDHPRLAALLFAITAGEDTALAERLASVGRTPARARIAHLLCDLVARARALDPEADALQMPLTQEEIGDVTGLTAVHVNRMLRGLADDGMIARRGNVIRLLSEARLIEEAHCIAARRLVTDWLPRAG
jgi:CRP/FNR family transcriptional regulator